MQGGFYAYFSSMDNFEKKHNTVLALSGCGLLTRLRIGDFLQDREAKSLFLIFGDLRRSFLVSYWYIRDADSFAYPDPDIYPSRISDPGSINNNRRRGEIQNILFLNRYRKNSWLGTSSIKNFVIRNFIIRNFVVRNSVIRNFLFVPLSQLSFRELHHFTRKLPFCYVGTGKDLKNVWTRL